MAIISAEEEHFCPVKYAYDYLEAAKAGKLLKPVNLPTNVRNALQWEKDKQPLSPRMNSIDFAPAAPPLPLYTGLSDFRQSKHWRTNVRANTELLQLFADDQTCKDHQLSDGLSMAKWAEICLERDIAESVGRFATYMFADADEDRMWLVGQAIILVFIFDDIWENASREFLNTFCDNFVARLEVRTSKQMADTPLQRRFKDISDKARSCDQNQGNGGQEVIDALVYFCKHPAPWTFTGVREYLDYRYDDAACQLLWACAKVSIRSDVDYTSDKLARFMRVLGDQISTVNDMASYEKEKHSFESGKALDMINLVQVIQDCDGVSPMEAKSRAFALQLQLEEEVSQELDALQDKGLSLEEWQFVRTCMEIACGNVSASVVIPRYGGEGWKI